MITKLFAPNGEIIYNADITDFDASATEGTVLNFYNGKRWQVMSIEKKKNIVSGQMERIVQAQEYSNLRTNYYAWEFVENFT